MLVEPIKKSKLSDAFFEESDIVSDCRQSYIAASPPPSYEPATLPHYLSPEARFTGKAGFEADVWFLVCTIFEIRAGFRLFDSLFGSNNDILRQAVEVLRHLPYPWWDAF